MNKDVYIKTETFHAASNVSINECHY